jgi:hypothetical protein
MDDESEWMLEYSDGSGNLLRVWSDGGPPEFSFSPVTPLHSSSGTYSGGEAASGLVSSVFTIALWRRIRELAADTDRHTPLRTMGSSAITIVLDEEATHFQMSRCEALAELDAWLRRELPIGEAGHR